jgi:RND family efflux transporter MFP subunit
MSDAKDKLEQGKRTDLRVVGSAEPATRAGRKARIRIVPFLMTLITTGLAALLGWATWDTYMVKPWTRDGTVRNYVVTMAPEVAGRIVQLPVVDNQFVHKGDLLLLIDPTNYRIAFKLADAAVQQNQAIAENAQREAERRRKLSELAVTVEQQQTYDANAVAAQAQYQQAVANRDQAKVNVERTEIRSPVNGWITNLLAQQGDYATVGQNVISVVDADSFWVDAYFEETQLASIQEGDPAKIKLMGYSPIIQGEVSGVARAINVENAQPNQAGLARVNPIFTWVRLAQRVPVRIRIKQVPDGVRLVAGMTATVQVDPRPERPSNQSVNAQGRFAAGDRSDQLQDRSQADKGSGEVGRYQRPESGERAATPPAAERSGGHEGGAPDQRRKRHRGLSRRW